MLSRSIARALFSATALGILVGGIGSCQSQTATMATDQPSGPTPHDEGRRPIEGAQPVIDELARAIVGAAARQLNTPLARPPDRAARIADQLSQAGASIGATCDLVVLDDDERLLVASVLDGYVVVTTGVFEHYSDDCAVAFLVAHELAHGTAGHGIGRLREEQLWSRLQEASAGPADAAAYDEYLRQVAVVLLAQQWTDEEEIHADATAMELLAQSGYSPECGVELLTSLLGDAGNAAPLSPLAKQQVGRRVANMRATQDKRVR